MCELFFFYTKISAILILNRGDQETFTVTSYSGGTFSTAAGTNFSTAPFSVGTVTVDSSGAASVTVFYTAPATASGTNYASLTFTVTDTVLSVSTPITVQVSINPANRAPTANPAGPIPLFQDSQSATWNLNGTDLDPADANTLVVQIMAIPTKGVLTQVGFGDITAAQTILNNPNIIYRSTQTGEDSFSFRVIDNLGATSSIQGVRLNITAVNHPPTAVLSPINMVQDTNATGTINTYDQDGDNVTVYITSLPRGYLYQFNGDAITAVPTALSDPQKRFKYQNIRLQSGTPYANFTFYADDGQRLNTSRSANITGIINVQGINYPPIPSILSIVLNENDANITFTLNATDEDTPVNTLTGFLTSLPSSAIGVLKDLSGNPLSIRTPIPGPRTIQFVPNPYAFGTTTFSFGVNDGVVDSSVTTATIVVNHVNQRPLLTTTSPITATRMVPLTVTLSVFDYDVGDNISIVISSISGGGQLSFNSVNITSTPFRLPVNFTIPNSNSVSIQLSYLAPANSSGTGYASISFVAQDSGLTSTTSTVSVSIAQNQLPSANPAGPLRAIQDFVSAPITLNGTDADVADAGSLAVIITALPAVGVLYHVVGNTNTTITAVNTVVPSGSVFYLTYQRAATQFSFAVRDNLGALSSPVTVTTVITPTNHAPSAYWIGTASALEDTILTITNIQASDPDAGDTITIIVPLAPSQGTLLQFNNVSCSYPCNVTDPQYRMRFVPGLHGFGTPYTTISFVASDGFLNSLPVGGPLNIIFVDYPPVANASTIAILENDASNLVSTNITLGYTDIDTLPMFINATIVSLPPSSFGTLATSTGQLLSIGDTVGRPFRVVFTPNAYTYGVTSFSFTVRDNVTTSNVAQITLNISHVNHPPVARWVGNAVGNEDTNVTITQIQVSDPDVGDTLTVIAYAPTNGTLFQFDGTPCASFPCTVSDSQYRMRFVPALHAFGYPYATFMFTATDGNLTSASVNGSITINFVDNPPIAYPATFNILEDESPKLLTLSYSDFDSPVSAISTTILSLPAPTYGRLTTQAGVPIAIGDTVNSLTIAFVQVPYSPGNTSFSFKVKDSLSFSNTVQVNLNILHVNHAPSVYWVGTAVADEDTMLNITQIQVSDPDAGDKVTVSVISGPPLNAVGGARLYQFNGVQCTDYPCAVVDQQYRMSFMPPRNAFGTPYTTIVVQAYDGFNYSRTADGNLTFNAVNDPPTVTGFSVNVIESSTATFKINVVDVDTDDDKLTVFLVTIPNPAIGSLMYNGATLQAGNSVPSGGDITFVAVRWANGDTNFTFYGYDGQYASDAAVVSISITAVPQDPICGVSPSSRLSVAYPSSTTVQLTLFDPDPNEKYTFTVTSVVDEKGVLKDPSGQAITAAPHVLATDITTTNMFGEIPVTYTVESDEDESYFYIEFTISDGTAVSAACNLSFNSSKNLPPNATAVPVIFTQENSDTDVFILNGVDDGGFALRVLITDLPRYGVLYQPGQSPITSASTYLMAGVYEVKYRPNPYFHGIDTFRFVVSSLLFIFIIITT